MICLKLKSRILGWDSYASIQGKLTASWRCSPGKFVHFGTPNSLLENLSLRITPPLPSKSMTSATKITGCSGQTWASKLAVFFANASNTPPTCFNGTLSGAFLIFLNQPRPRYIVLVCPTKIQPHLRHPILRISSWKHLFQKVAQGFWPMPILWKHLKVQPDYTG